MDNINLQQLSSSSSFSSFSASLSAQLEKMVPVPVPVPVMMKVRLEVDLRSVNPAVRREAEISTALLDFPSIRYRKDNGQIHLQ